MEQPKYLIDTNAVIDYLGTKFPVLGMDFMNSVIDAVPNISVITKIEVLGFKAPEQHYKILSDFINDAYVLDMTDNVVETSIEIRKTHKTKLPDAIIAATAFAFGYTLITNNEKDFIGLNGLKVLNPHKL
jgi:predicted nucleic acid-binding protein